jgi:hypothetical protein
LCSHHAIQLCFATMEIGQGLLMHLLQLDVATLRCDQFEEI